jgi:precorrin-6Y C5,15-methyltransferase (decarboxylating)
LRARSLFQFTEADEVAVAATGFDPEYLWCTQRLGFCQSATHLPFPAATQLLLEVPFAAQSIGLEFFGRTVVPDSGYLVLRFGVTTVGRTQHTVVEWLHGFPRFGVSFKLMTLRAPARISRPKPNSGRSIGDTLENRKADGKVFIVGVGDDGLGGLTDQAREVVRMADLVFGAEQTLSRVAQLSAEKVAVGTELRDVARRIEQERLTKRIVVLASGDPLFYGVARYLCERIGKEHFVVLPHVSSMQLAFARVKESWEDAYLTSLANRNPDDVVDRVRTCEKVGIFTSESCSPADFARELLRNEISYFRAYVCENLGSPDERVTQGELDEVAEMTFAPMNVMILIRKPNYPDRMRSVRPFQTFGNPDDTFAQDRPQSVLVTQAEVRAVALAQLNLRPTSVVWDIGAGSGSVAIEAAQLASSGTVYAIERDAADYQLMLSNAERFGVRNLRAIHGRAPEVFRDLPTPDAIFVGATGRELGPLLDDAYKRLGRDGRIVINVAALDTLHQVHAAFRALESEPSVWMIQVSRGTHQLGSVRFEGLNPTFLLAITKTGK